MKLRNFLFVLIASIVFIGCNNETEKFNLTNDYFSLKNDTSFVLNKTPDEFQGIFMNDFKPFWNVMLNNKVNISFYEHYKTFHYFIKEFGSDSINRFYYFSNKLSFNTSNYDSVEYDDKIIIEIMSNGNLNHLDSMSRTFYNIHKLREKDLENNTRYNDYKNKLVEVESIINNMECFEHFNPDNSEQFDLLKKLIFYLRICTMNFDDYMSHNLSSSVLSYSSISEINNENELSEFEDYLKSAKYYDKKLTTYWRMVNDKFLLKKIPEIKKDLKKKGTFILRTNFPETKVFLYNVSEESGKIKLKENYVNVQYMWYHPIYGIWEPGIRI